MAKRSGSIQRINPVLVTRNYLASVDSEWFNQRLARFIMIVLAAFCILAARLIYLQLIKGEELRRLSEINSIRLQDIDGPRGLIMDTTHQALADNRASFNLYIVLKDAQPLGRTLEKLSAVLNEPLDELNARIRASKKRGSYAAVLIKGDLSRDMLAAVEVHRFELPGIQVQVAPRRHYLYEKEAAHLLGYLGEINQDELQHQTFDGCKSGDFIGKFGVEKAYEPYLRGKRGGRQVEVNAVGQVERVLGTVHSEPGNNVVLTIDWNLQQKAEQMMADQVGAAVAIDPDSGKLLALVSRPSFDPNQFVSGINREAWNELVNNSYRPLENKALQAEYPPASTYKIVVATAGLEEGVITDQSHFFCPGYYSFAGRQYKCWKKGGHGQVDVVKGLAESCDVFFYRVGEALGVDRIAKYAKALGLGGSTEFSLDREGRGLIPTAEWKLKRFGVPWQKGETLSIAIGQGFNLVTPIQMAVLAATVGNGGLRYKPYLLEKIQSPEGAVLLQSTPKEMGRLRLKPATVQLVHQGLWEVVNAPRGTAYRSRLKEVEFSGKTGTAQVIGRKEGEEKFDKNGPKDHAWFVAYAPSEHPKIAVAVLVEHGEHGSSAAAPVASAMIKAYLGKEVDQTVIGGGKGDGKKDDAAGQGPADTVPARTAGLEKSPSGAVQ